MKRIVNSIRGIYQRAKRELTLSARTKEVLGNIFTLWLLFSLVIIPCILDMNNMSACLVYIVNLVLSLFLARKFNPSIR